jgi:acetolactate synthase-1/3 small subunit
MPQHTLLVMLKDRPGALHRAVSLFRRRGFNISSLMVSRSDEAGVSRMTVVVDALTSLAVVRQLERLLDVVSVRDVSDDPSFRSQADGGSIGEHEAA